jgi:hypothetical protein
MVRPRKLMYMAIGMFSVHLFFSSVMCPFGILLIFGCYLVKHKHLVVMQTMVETVLMYVLIVQWIYRWCCS